MSKTDIVLLICAVIGLSAIGCSQQAAQTAGNQISHGVVIANKAVGRAVAESRPKLRALNIVARVTTAIEVNQNLPDDAIRVDAVPTGVRLRGVVANKHQKDLAGQVAKDTLKPGEKIDNEIKIKKA